VITAGKNNASGGHRSALQEPSVDHSARHDGVEARRLPGLDAAQPTRTPGPPPPRERRRVRGVRLEPAPCPCPAQRIHRSRPSSRATPTAFDEDLELLALGCAGATRTGAEAAPAETSDPDPPQLEGPVATTGSSVDTPERPRSKACLAARKPCVGRSPGRVSVTGRGHTGPVALLASAVDDRRRGCSRKAAARRSDRISHSTRNANTLRQPFRRDLPVAVSVRPRPLCSGDTHGNPPHPSRFGR
jgi:hypothetical protein